MIKTWSNNRNCVKRCTNPCRQASKYDEEKQFKKIVQRTYSLSQKKKQPQKLMKVLKFGCVPSCVRGGELVSDADRVVSFDPDRLRRRSWKVNWTRNDGEECLKLKKGWKRFSTPRGKKQLLYRCMRELNNIA